MRTPPDLHPDDLGVRENLRDMLEQVREEIGISHRELGERTGQKPATAWKMARSVNWQFSTTQRWAAGLELRLVVYPECSPLDEYVNLLRPQDLLAGLAFDRAAFKEVVVDARHIRGMNQQQLADALGVSGNAVGHFEKEQDPLMVSMQRYCRALGTVLVVELEDLPPTLGVAA